MLILIDAAESYLVISNGSGHHINVNKISNKNPLHTLEMSRNWILDLRELLCHEV